MEIYRIKSKETKKNHVTGWTVPVEYTTGTFDIVGFNPETNMVFVVDRGNHYFVNGIQYANAYDATKWLFETIDGKTYDFIKGEN